VRLPTTDAGGNRLAEDIAGEPVYLSPGWSSARGRSLTAPHRLGFFAAAALMATTAAWWAVVLGLQCAGVAVQWAMTRPLAHSLAMAFSFMTLFIARRARGRHRRRTGDGHGGGCARTGHARSRARGGARQRR
jgi:hypothetical protein